MELSPVNVAIYDLIREIFMLSVIEEESKRKPTVVCLWVAALYRYKGC